MDFIDRKNEPALLRGIRETAKTTARMTILKGRRRVGKTSILQRAYGDEELLRRKADAFLTSAAQYAGYEKAFSGLSLADM